MPTDESQPEGDDPVTEVIERTEQQAREVADRALEELGLPKTQRLEEIFDDAVEQIERTIVLPSPSEVLDHAVEGAEWLQRQLEPLGDRMDRMQDQLERVRHDAPVDEPPEEDDGWGVITWAVFAAFIAWLLGRELTYTIDVDRALWSFDEDDVQPQRFVAWNEAVFTPPDAFAARLFDPMMHGDPAAPGVGSATVLIGGMPALRKCDSHVCTKVTPVPHLGTGFRGGEGTVLIEGFPALRVGDYVDEGPHGPNPIVSGCLSVTIGAVAPPVRCWQPGAETQGHRPDLFPFRWTKGELGHFKGKVVLGVDISGPLVRVDGTVTAARLWAEETAVVDIPLGDYDFNGRPNALRVSKTAKLERVFGVSDVTIDVHPLAKRVDEFEVRPKHVEQKPPELGEPKYDLIEEAE